MENEKVATNSDVSSIEKERKKEKEILKWKNRKRTICTML